MPADDHRPEDKPPETFQDTEREFLEWKSGYLMSRRDYDDTSMWQAPALGLTAQAFLLTIALGTTATNVGRVLSAMLAMITALASLYLIYRKRFQAMINEKEFNELAKRLYPGQSFGASFEERAAIILQHPIPPRLRRPATDVWILALYLFILADLYIVVLTVAGSLTLLPP